MFLRGTAAKKLERFQMKFQWGGYNRGKGGEELEEYVYFKLQLIVIIIHFILT